MDTIGIKPAPGDHESNFKKVGALPSEPVTMNEFSLNPEGILLKKSLWIHVNNSNKIF